MAKIRTSVMVENEICQTNYEWLPDGDNFITTTRNYRSRPRYPTTTHKYTSRPSGRIDTKEFRDFIDSYTE